MRMISFAFVLLFASQANAGIFGIFIGCPQRQQRQDDMATQIAMLQAMDDEDDDGYKYKPVIHAYQGFGNRVRYGVSIVPVPRIQDWKPELQVVPLPSNGNGNGGGAYIQPMPYPQYVPTSSSYIIRYR